MAKVTFLFWNMNRQPRTGLVAELTREHDVDILMLAECEVRPAQILSSVNQGRTSKLYQFHNSPSNTVLLFTRFPRESVSLVGDHGRLSIRRVVSSTNLEVLLVTAHLPSKLRMKTEDLSQYAADIVRYIEESELTAGHSRTIVCGDLNMNPFEHGLVGAAGFNAVMSRAIAGRGTRTVQGIRRKFFYNPMWNFLGDHCDGPPGSYYLSESTHVAYFWHMFDQVLLRPDILPRFDNKDLSILTEINGKTLLSRSNVPDPRIGSDHLPVLFRLDL